MYVRSLGSLFNLVLVKTCYNNKNRGRLKISLQIKRNNTLVLSRYPIYLISNLTKHINNSSIERVFRQSLC